MKFSYKLYVKKDKNPKIIATSLSTYIGQVTFIKNILKVQNLAKIKKFIHKSTYLQICAIGPLSYTWFFGQVSFQTKYICLVNWCTRPTYDILPIQLVDVLIDLIAWKALISSLNFERSSSFSYLVPLSPKPLNFTRNSFLQCPSQLTPFLLESPLLSSSLICWS